MNEPWRRPIAYLGAGLLRQLRAVAPSLVACRNVEDLLSNARRDADMTVIADPALDGAQCADAMIGLRAASRSRGIIGYTTLNALVVPELVRLASHGIVDIVLFECDDDAPRLTRLLAGTQVHRLEDAVAARLAPHVAILPGRVADAVAAVFVRPTQFRTTGDLALAARVSRSTIHRELRRAGFRSPRLLVAAGRVARAVVMMAAEGRTLRATAAGLRYESPEHLAAMLMTLTGLGARQIKRGVDAAHVSATMHERIIRPATV